MENGKHTQAFEVIGALLVCLGIILYVNRWNTLNGKAGALGCWLVGAMTAKINHDFTVPCV
jgi:hypothetical protein